MTALLVTLALAADLLTARADAELNPISRAILQAGPLAAFATKTALCALVLATVVLCRRWRPGRLAGVVAGVAVVVGTVGAVSNLGVR